ncbi:MAG: malonyl-CoA decarboxylase domain-containing protein [Acidimicrobiales bacterium]
MRPTLGSLGGAVRLWKGGRSPQLSDRDQRRLRDQIAACLEAGVSEVSARARAAEVADLYAGLDDVGRGRFFELLALEYGPDRGAVEAAIEARRAVTVRDALDQHELAAADLALRRALTPPRARLLTLFNGLDHGLALLVELRAELLPLLAQDARLRSLEVDLEGLLKSWFDIGLLELRRLSWDSPAALLEKLIRYEAVHSISSWADLKNRLDSDRRCYAFFHPGMPDEPLIFVEVALVSGLADNVGPLLDTDAPLGDPGRADTAIFYSISNCQPGLAGINLGDFLIKRVVRRLAAELPSLKTFATLSPMPGFRRWLDARLAEEGDRAFRDAETAALAAALDGAGPAEVMARLLADPSWPEEPSRAGALRPALVRLGARYLIQERARGRAIDPVANFHLSNGASVERINFLANASPQGIAQSAGLMVNYRYDLSSIDANVEAYLATGRSAAAGALTRLLAG